MSKNKKKIENKYHIVYVKAGSVCSTTATVIGKITESVLADIIDTIKKESGCSSIVILNWKKLVKED